MIAFYVLVNPDRNEVGRFLIVRVCVIHSVNNVGRVHWEITRPTPYRTNEINLLAVGYAVQPLDRSILCHSQLVLESTYDLQYQKYVVTKIKENEK